MYNMVDDDCLKKPIISRDDFAGGFAIFTISIEPHLPDDEFTQRRSHGLNRLTIRFKDVLSEAVTVILYAKFPKVLAIDQARNILPGH